jgi:hypothetical protein
LWVAVPISPLLSENVAHSNRGVVVMNAPTPYPRSAALERGV